MTVTNGRSAPSKIQRLLDTLRFKLRERLIQYVSVRDQTYTYTFRCETPVERWRAETLLVKEEGTVRWILAEAQEGDVFYDIGANIGLYTLLAAKRVGQSGMVYAFEPHLTNAHSLLQNVSRNGLNDRVKVLSCALNDCDGFFDFNYNSWIPGSSMSQLHGNRDDKEQEFQPVFSELKFATTIDNLIHRHMIRPADLIKLDVDGNESLILQGMEQIFSSPHPPRSIQVEVSLRNKDQLYQFMHAHAFEACERHDTLAGKQKIARGHDPACIAHNVIFRPKG